MDNNRKKELKELYKITKPSMGVYQIKNIMTGKAYIGISQNLKGTMNGNLAKLNGGMFKDRELLEDWKKYGEDKFEQKILAELDYEEDEAKSDYMQDLLVLRELITETYKNVKNI